MAVLGRIIGSGLLCIALAVPAQAARVKELARVDGVRDNQLVGYGLVVGLAGSGDSDQAKFAVQTLMNALERSGVTVARNELVMKNAATVMVTATLPAFARQGSRLDVHVASVGDAKSLAGGTLLMTPLKAADGGVYAVAQGGVLTGAFSYGGTGSQAKTHLTAGRVPAGALVERELPFALPRGGQLLLNLLQPDFGTAANLTVALNAEFGAGTARGRDAGVVTVAVPAGYQADPVGFIARLEALECKADGPARVVINERTGTVVMGEQVRVGRAAIAHGNLVVKIREAAPAQAVTRPAGGELPPPPPLPATTARDQAVHLLEPDATVGGLVKALNAVGVTPRDLISILQGLAAAGALSAEVVLQ